VYKTWFKNYSGVKTLSSDQLGKIDLGGVMFVRAGTKLVKSQTSKTVYAVEPGGRLAAIDSPDAAVSLYGANWKSMVLTMPDSFMGAYTKTTKVLDGSKYPEGQLVKKGKNIFYTTGNADFYHIQSMKSFKDYGFDLKYVVNCALEQKKVYDLEYDNLFLSDKTSSVLKNKPVYPKKNYDTLYKNDPTSIENAKQYFSNTLVNDFFARQDVKNMVNNSNFMRISYFDEKHLSFSFNSKDGTQIVGLYSTATGNPVITKATIDKRVLVSAEGLMGENLVYYAHTYYRTYNSTNESLLPFYLLPEHATKPYFVLEITASDCTRDASCKLNYPMDYVERSGLLNK
jgi:hypothetical protein